MITDGGKGGSVVEGMEAGFPGFVVRRQPRLLANVGTLKRIAMAKLSSIRMISASFSGTRLLFQPWLTMLIDEGHRAFVVGVYRTDSALSEPEGEGPTFCLRKSIWRRDADLDSARKVSELRSYLSNGDQIENRFTFLNHGTRPGVIRGTEDFVASMGEAGLTLRAADRADMHWKFISLEVGDEVRAFGIDYSPITTSIDLVESTLPQWLALVDGAVAASAIKPDGPLTITIDRSVPELLSQPGKPE
ncbi:hypothetical protein KBX50_14775 [Micromonospora sp. C51]|nr:hypothetical protein [Micromonospora sp. C51]